MWVERHREPGKKRKVRADRGDQGKQKRPEQAMEARANKRG